jgi:hypothetical protein
MIVGIAGPSCSGKTTLAHLLGSALTAPVLHLDRHWIEGCEKPVVEGFPSYERPHQYDADALIAEIRAIRLRHPIIVVEGFLLFHYQWFRDACARRVFLDVPHERLAVRRRARLGLAVDDVPGGRAPEADAGWSAHGRSEWLRFGAAQRDLPGMEVVTRTEDGGDWPDSMEEIAHRLVSAPAVKNAA